MVACGGIAVSSGFLGCLGVLAFCGVHPFRKPPATSAVDQETSR
jgi:hypothetical protein